MCECNYKKNTCQSASEKKKDWVFTDYSFEELYDAYFTVRFEYQGKRYRLSCEGDHVLYDEKTGKAIWHFNNKKEFYSGVVFGRPIQNVIDDSYMIELC